MSGCDNDKSCVLLSGGLSCRVVQGCMSRGFHTLRVSAFARRCCLARRCRARLEPGRCSSALGHPIPKKATMKAAFPGMARPRGLLAAKRLALRVCAFARRCCLARRLPGSARTGEVLIGPRAPHTKKGHHEGGLSRYGAPERITRRKAARPSGQRLCKALLSRPALPGSARTGEVFIGPRGTPYQKRPP